MKKLFLFFLLISCHVKETYNVNKRVKLNCYILKDRIDLKEKEVVYKLHKEDQDVEKLTREMIFEILSKIDKYQLKKEKFNSKFEEIATEIEKLRKECNLNYTENGEEKDYKYLLKKCIKEITLSLESYVLNFNFAEELNKKGSEEINNYVNSLFKKYLESIEEIDNRNEGIEFREEFKSKLISIFNLEGSSLDEYFNIKSYIQCKLPKDFDKNLFRCIINTNKEGLETLILSLKKDYFYFINSVVESLDLIKNLKIIFDKEKSGKHENVFGKCEYIKPSFTASTLGGKKENMCLMLSEKGILYANNKKAYKGIPLKVRKYTIF